MPLTFDVSKTGSLLIARWTASNIENEKLVFNAKIRGEQLKIGLNELKEKLKIIGDVRGIGLLQGLELVKDKKTKTERYCRWGN